MADCDHRWVLTVRRAVEERFDVSKVWPNGDWTGSMLGGQKTMRSRRRLTCSRCGETRTDIGYRLP